jgi:gliding motility associated protien GldN|tara:strand:- start:711 stop:1568 length:858 start_codon:yes stop_codon:yes gene_type:complete
MKKLFLLFLVSLIVFSFESNAQESTVLDGIYVKENFTSRRVIPYTSLREADVMWNKRVWRRIDIREKQNQVLYFPVKELSQGRKNFFEVVYDAVMNEGTITAYSPGSVVEKDDMFTTPLTPEEVLDALSEEVVNEQYDDFGSVVGYDTLKNTIESSKIRYYDIKEEWFFDKQRSVMDVRIIGIHPIVEKQNAETGDMELLQTFWVYYPEARFVFANNEVFNRTNDSERRTFEDIFWKRQFASRIVKVSNVYDRDIANYRSGIDALLESEKLKEEIFNVEHDLWSY